MATEAAVLLWILGALAGSMLFFALVVAPRVFRSLTPDQAGKFLRSFFPGYYTWGLILATASAAIATWSSPMLSLACAAVAVLFVYARQSLMPKINAARDAQLELDAEAEGRFNRLHLQSVVINGAQLLVLLGVAGVLLWQPVSA
jgi:hypothetical protein